MTVTQQAPRRRGIVTSRGQALGVLVATGAAIVGLVLLVVVYVGIGTRTLQASADGTGGPCLQAYAADEAGADVRYLVAPPQSVCSWDVDGARQEVVVASAPAGLAATGALLAGGGVLAAAALLVVPRLRR
ncbi:hypothetical protein [Cellulomonas biazotea]|uniref:Uncharacterized protein n=1 Tax=Cellulomonas biazotea TaxID=1709 RepID=A0A402DRF0_9CELL|nr:hypothetical protein [Cellulomonas biazotea]GCE76713.1 hypothetical protein CBZ_17690 [Cellulomonas biazotea]